ncbi:MAG: stage II sporulation protein D [Clostridia bacterium]|nr:stage II sporulation protein D [Clostridia bacterium]
MRRILTISLLMWSSVFALPAAIVSGGRAATVQTTAVTTAATVQTTQSSPTAAATTARPSEPPKISDTLFLLSDGKRIETDLEELVASVVAAEMPALWPTEALKAQAVAVRSYILWRMAAPPSDHPDCPVCSSPAHCFAVADLEALAESWGSQGQSYIERVTSAVEATKGEILTYGGEPIMAVFHAMSAFRTDSCADIWGGEEIPYLKSVPTPLSEQGEAGFETEVAVNAEDFRAAFLRRYPSAVLGTDPEKWFTEIEKAASGSVLTLLTGGVEITGGVLRQMCGLRSAAFDIRVERSGDLRLVFTVYGYGHGVGMSQYGAKNLALEGMDYTRILSHYYPGTVLTNSR